MQFFFFFYDIKFFGILCSKCLCFYTFKHWIGGKKMKIDLGYVALCKGCKIMIHYFEILLQLYLLYFWKYSILQSYLNTITNSREPHFILCLFHTEYWQWIPFKIHFVMNETRFAGNCCLEHYFCFQAIGFWFISYIIWLWYNYSFKNIEVKYMIVCSCCKHINNKKCTTS